MAYVRHGTGPNDHKKGNRTRGKDRRGNLAGSSGADPEQLRRNGQMIKEMTDYYRELAEARKNVVKYTPRFMTTALHKIEEYIEDQQDRGKPVTMAGMMLAGDIGKDAWAKGIDGEYDHVLYQYMDINGIPYNLEGTIVQDQETGEEVLLVCMSDQLKRLNLIVQQQREEACSSNKGNPAGNIFLLKAQQGFRDDPEHNTTYSSQTLIIADREQAVKALEMLKPSDSNGSSGSGNNW